MRLNLLKCNFQMDQIMKGLYEEGEIEHVNGRIHPGSLYNGFANPKIEGVKTWWLFIRLSFSVHAWMMHYTCTYKLEIQWDPVYPHSKDLEHSVYQTALVSIQVCKTKPLAEYDFGTEIVIRTVSLVGKLSTF